MKLKERLQLSLVLIAMFMFYTNTYAQQLIEIPDVKNYKQVASGLNGGPTLATGDDFGRSVANIGDINNDGITDVAVGAPLDNSFGNPDGGCVYICFMNADGSVKTNPAPQKIGSGLGIIDNDNFGISVTGLGDLNGDGNEDIAVGAYKSDVTSFTDCGAVYIIFLNNSGGVVSYQKITRTTTEFNGQIGANSYFGISVANIGDINNDQTNDIAVGAYNHDGTQGAVFVLRLRTNGKVKYYNEIKEGSGNLGVSVLDGNDFFGYAVSGAGDLNGDGIEDLIAGASGDDDGYSNAGALWVIYLDTAGTVYDKKKLSNPLTSSHYFPAVATVSFGECISVTDINEDGVKDIMAGVKTFNGSKGGFYFMVLDSTQNVQAIKTTGFTYGWNYTGPSTVPQFGCSLSEINLSGNAYHKQYIVGANLHKQGAGSEGSFYYINMDSLKHEFPVGTVLNYTAVSDFSGDFTATLVNSDFLGADAANIGDLNNDGVDDIVVGAPGDDSNSETNSGAVYVLFMTADGRVSAYQKIAEGVGGLGNPLAANDQFGHGVAPAGDWNGDGNEDVFVGSLSDDNGGVDRGSVYLLYLNNNGTVNSKVEITNSTSNEFFGVDVDTIGDLDNDGVNDLAVGVYQCDEGGSNRGAVDILFMNSNATVKSRQRISDTNGGFADTLSNSDFFGIAVDGIGDFDGDGVEDIAVGSNKGGIGAAFLIFLNTNGTVKSFKRYSNSLHNFPYTHKTGQSFGNSVQMVSDMDGNGVRDLLISSPGYKTYTLSRGGVWIAFLDSSANVIDAKIITDSSGMFYTNMNDVFTLGYCARYYGTDSLGNLKMIFGTRDDGGGMDRGGLLLSSLTTGRLAKFFTHQFTELKKSPDAGTYGQSAGIVRFVYNEEYQVGSSKKLQYRLYKNTHQLIAEVNASGTATITGSPLLPVVYGKNKVVANFAPLGLASGYYLLEVINAKNEKFYLKFKV